MAARLKKIKPRVDVLHEHKYYKKLRNSLGTYPNKKDALQIGSAPGLHLTNVFSRDTQGMEKEHKNCK